MRRLVLYLSFAFLDILLWGCAHTEITHREMQSVLSYYKDSVSHSLKYETAKFLVENMDVHYGISGNGIDSFHYYMDSVFSLPVRSDGFYKNAYDSAYALYGKEIALSIRNNPDTAMIKAEMLINYIDAAFDVWNRQWSGTYDFNHFCSYGGQSGRCALCRQRAYQCAVAPA